MSEANQDVLERLRLVLVDWDAEITSSQQRILEKLGHTRRHLDELAEEGSAEHECSLAELEAARSAAEARNAFLEQEVERLERELASVQALRGEAARWKERAESLEKGLAAEKALRQAAELRAFPSHDIQDSDAAGRLAKALRDRDEAHQEIARLRRLLNALSQTLPTARPADSSEACFRSLDKEGRRQRLGAMLVSAGLLEEHVLAESLDEQRQMPGRLIGDLLVEGGNATEETVARALAAQMGLPFKDVASIVPNAVAIESLGIAFLCKHGCIPIALDAGTVTLAMANPMDKTILDEVKQKLGRRIHTVIATPTAIGRSILRHAGGSVPSD